MNKNPVNVNKNVCRLECLDGCGEIQVEYWDGDGEIILSYYIPKFYQDSIVQTLKNRLKMVWSILIGKEYRLYELCLDTKQSVEKFKDFVAKIDTTKLYYDE